MLMTSPEELILRNQMVIMQMLCQMVYREAGSSSLYRMASDAISKTHVVLDNRKGFGNG